MAGKVTSAWQKVITAFGQVMILSRVGWLPKNRDREWDCFIFYLLIRFTQRNDQLDSSVFQREEEVTAYMQLGSSIMKRGEFLSNRLLYEFLYSTGGCLVFCCWWQQSHLSLRLSQWSIITVVSPSLAVITLKKKRNHEAMTKKNTKSDIYTPAHIAFKYPLIRHAGTSYVHTYIHTHSVLLAVCLFVQLL